MCKKRSVSASTIRLSAGFSLILWVLLTNSPAMAGTLTGGATLPEQVVQEITGLQSYAQEATSAMSGVQTQMNTLNSYMVQLQNMMSLPAQEISQITMPAQQMLYNYNEAQGLMSEYQSMYGNLSNIQQTVTQQNMDILNSSLSPQDYLNTVETAQGNTAALTRAQLQSTANSMQAVDALGPQIMAQSQAIHGGGYNGNTRSLEQLGSELNTIEQQNQYLLAALNQANLARTQRLSTHEAEDAAAASSAALAAQEQSNANAVTAFGNMANGSAASAGALGNGEQTFMQCVANGGTYATCNY